MATNHTPMIQQYKDIKQAFSNEILFFRLGDFYEMFFDDAIVASRELEITLTSRDGGAPERIPMCGVPYHAAENYIAKLIQKGYKVAICEQVEDPKQAKGIVRREVIKIITPGTFLSDTAINDKNNNYLSLLYETEGGLGIASADVATGECIWSCFTGNRRTDEICDYLAHLRPAELVFAGEIDNYAVLEAFIDSRLPECAKTKFVPENSTQAQEMAAAHFPAEQKPQPVCAYNAVAFLILYMHNTIKSDLSHFNCLIRHNPTEYLVLDAATQRNLEISRNMRDNSRKDTLLSTLDFTKTSMGGRLLKKWLEQPLVNSGQIIQRQEAVGELLSQTQRRKILRELLDSIYDLERILAKVEIGTANPRDLAALRSSLAVLPDIRQQLQAESNFLLKSIFMNIYVHADVFNLISAAIVENPPLNVREGGIIKNGYDVELDELRSIATDSREWLQSIETREREKTGIRSLKVGYNKVFGYFIEVTHSNTGSVPDTYIRKQTLVNAERYITPELKEFETKILGAQEKISHLEYHIFLTLKDYIKDRLKDIQNTARQIAALDAVSSLSEAADRYNYVRPQISSGEEIVIKDGRHPVVEKLLQRDLFVPNDAELNHRDNEIMIITGPNMAGKSTYMRQVALLVLMAQTGSFIPCREASITPVDRIFTRVGASDDLATGQSTFMVEMNEVAHILQNATQNSLVILDEIGRGTSTFDGMSIARAVLEYIRDKIRAKTLFATHYHELTVLEDTSAVVKNYRVAVKEKGNQIVFLHRIVPGSADKSYGIHVAQLAGLPKKVIDRAHELLGEMENCQPVIAERSLPTATTKIACNISLFQSTLADAVLKQDVMSLTPLEALNILYRLQQQAKEEAGKI